MNEQGYLVTGWRPAYPKSGRYLLPPGSGRVGADGKAVLNLARLRTVSIVEVTDEE